jgi:hypothetical protein
MTGMLVSVIMRVSVTFVAVYHCVCKSGILCFFYSYRYVDHTQSNLEVFPVALPL